MESGVKEESGSEGKMVTWDWGSDFALPSSFVENKIYIPFAEANRGVFEGSSSFLAASHFSSFGKTGCEGEAHIDLRFSDLSMNQHPLEGLLKCTLLGLPSELLSQHV